MGERLGEGPNVYLPVTMKAELTPGWKGFDDRRSYWITLLASSSTFLCGKSKPCRPRLTKTFSRNEFWQV